MRSWSSLLARVSMSGKTPDDEERIVEFVEKVVVPGHHVISYDPSAESVLVLSSEAARHLRALVESDGCDMCERVLSQLEIQEARHALPEED